MSNGKMNNILKARAGSLHILFTYAFKNKNHEEEQEEKRGGGEKGQLKRSKTI